MSRAVYQRRTVTCLATLTESDCTVVLQQKCDSATLIIFISTTTTTTIRKQPSESILAALTVNSQKLLHRFIQDLKHIVYFYVFPFISLSCCPSWFLSGAYIGSPAEPLRRP